MKLDFNRLADIMRAWQTGKDMSQMPWAQGQQFALSGGQPRTFRPGPQPVVPFMPQAQQSGPVTFMPSMNLGMGPLTGGVPQTAFPGGVPAARRVMPVPMMNTNLGMGKTRK